MNRRILLVDDHADFQRGVRSLLVPQYEVVLAQSGVEALARMEREGPFAVVVSDYGMPGMTGIELLGELAAEWPETVRILLTGCADLGLALEALEKGAIFRFLTKPPDARRLRDAVAAGVQRFHASSEERTFTEQLSFARESLQTLNGVLETRLERALASLDRLAKGTESIAESESLEDLCARTTLAMRDLLGTRAPEVRVDPLDGGIEIGPAPELRQRERRGLEILTRSARSALASARQRRNARESQEATLRALEGMARQRDGGTGEHLARVSAHVRTLALGLRAAGLHRELLTDEYVESLALTAPLHDIGKVAVPDAILFKPGPLDEGEWAIMRTHASVGAEILRGALAARADAALLALARDLAWTHHERWDGAGYPRGLAGAAIPLSGRIMALADCYDALTSERPYKRAWKHEEAAAHLAEQRGKAFDPDVVDAFFAHEPEFQARAAALSTGT